MKVYVPPADVRPGAVSSGSGKRTICPYKGEASYWNVGPLTDAAWSYETAAQVCAKSSHCPSSSGSSVAKSTDVAARFGDLNTRSAVEVLHGVENAEAAVGGDQCERDPPCLTKPRLRPATSGTTCRARCPRFASTPSISGPSRVMTMGPGDAGWVEHKAHPWCARCCAAIPQPPQGSTRVRQRLTVGVVTKDRQGDQGSLAGRDC